MVYVIGLDTDPVFVYFLRECIRRSVPVQPINLRAVVMAGQWRLRVPDDGQSFFVIDDERIVLDPQGAYYYRGADLSALQNKVAEEAAWRGLTASVTAWLEHIPGLVINRPSAGAHNSAKPLHESIIAQLGLLVPDSLTSAEPNRLEQFAAEGRTVVKALSGIRANAREVFAPEFRDYEPRRGPVHLQRLVHGADVRAHVFGDVVQSEIIHSTAVDYRAGAGNRFRPHQLPAPLTAQVILATRRLGLTFAGWDFKRDAEGTYWCLECNPMPGYYPYDRRLGGCITDALIAAFDLNPSSISHVLAAEA